MRENVQIQNGGTAQPKNAKASLVILAFIFFIMGALSWVNTILIPYFKLTCQLNHLQSSLVTFAFYISYFFMAIPSSFIINKIGYKRGIMYGLWIMSLGALMFVPAAYWRTYEVFLMGLFLLGVGLTMLQAAANPFVTLIGPRESAARRLSIVGTGNKLAGILANFIFAAVVIRESDKVLMKQIKNGAFTGSELEVALDTLIKGVITPYLILSIILFIFGIYIRYSVLPELDARVVNKSSISEQRAQSSIIQFPALILGVIGMFCHVGTQMIALATIINYAGTMGLGLEGPAKNFPSFTMIFTFIGYFIGIILIPKYLKQRMALLICSVSNLILALLVIFITGKVTILGMDTDISIWFLVLMGLPNALIYTGIWPLAIRGLGRFTNLGSSLLVMALCGSAVLPFLYNYFVETSSGTSSFEAMKTAYWIFVPCFLYLIYYALLGYKLNSWTRQKG